MGDPAPDTVSFVAQNILLVGGLGLLVFIFFVFLTRKRWKANFLHPRDDREKQGPDDQDGDTP